VAVLAVRHDTDAVVSPAGLGLQYREKRLRLQSQRQKCAGCSTELKTFRIASKVSNGMQQDSDAMKCRGKSHFIQQGGMEQM
jgi:hypothetical protein